MSIELIIPELGESITEVEIGAWLKNQGEQVGKDEPLVSLESEKATVELPAPASGTLLKIRKQNGETAHVGEVIGLMEAGDKKPPAVAHESTVKTEGAPQKPATAGQKTNEKVTESPEVPKQKPVKENLKTRDSAAERRVMPAAERALAETGLHAEQVEATGPGGRLLKEDVLRQSPPPQTSPPKSAGSHEPPVSSSEKVPPAHDREEEIVPMSRLRRTVAERLVEAQHSAALLTTFNEVDVTHVMTLRKQYGEEFQRKYNVKLGLMSFFVKACVDALKQVPTLNAEVRDSSIVYHNYFDIGVAVGSGKGLVVPVLRNAERMSLAEIESAIGDFAQRAKENKLKIEELRGGTFTISNGGVYGSLLSTPIVNPPQSGVLGMHAIQDRPVAREGIVVIRPMMYLALTYDHRIVDGREAVAFLKRIRQVIEEPARILIEI